MYRESVPQEWNLSKVDKGKENKISALSYLSEADRDQLGASARDVESGARLIRVEQMKHQEGGVALADDEIVIFVGFFVEGFLVTCP